MSYEREIKDAAEGRIGADRMALGLSIIPDPLYGDMKEIDRLTAELAAYKKINHKQWQGRMKAEAERDALQAKLDKIESGRTARDAAPVPLSEWQQLVAERDALTALLRRWLAVPMTITIRTRDLYRDTRAAIDATRGKHETHG